MGDSRMFFMLLRKISNRACNKVLSKALPLSSNALRHSKSSQAVDRRINKAESSHCVPQFISANKCDISRHCLHHTVKDKKCDRGWIFHLKYSHLLHRYERFLLFFCLMTSVYLKTSPLFSVNNTPC